MPIIPHVCRQCGQTFSAHTAHKRRYCSRACTHNGRSGNLADRFWSNVQKSPDPAGCWLWVGTVLNNGYGQMQYHSHQRAAHRLSYELAFGPIPAGLDCLHRCDNPRCVRPDHLFLGTDADNMRDKMVKGRAARGATHGSQTHPERLARGERNGAYVHPERVPRGSQHSHAKLTEDQVREIRALRAQGLTYFAIAAQFGIDFTNVYAIVHRKTWQHVE